MSTIFDSITGIISLLSLLLAGLVVWERGKRKEAEQEKEVERLRAERERDARQHIQKTAKKTRKVDDAIDRTSADARRERLRDYAKPSSDSD